MASEILPSAKGSRVYIFDDDVVEKDDSAETEVPPKRLSTLSGLGSSGGAGKYDGFGNSPISKENFGDKVLDLVESALAPLDSRSEVMEMCLQSSTGEYKAIEIAAGDGMLEWEAASLGPAASIGPMASKKEPKRHIPGKAGGGWEDDDDQAEEEREQLLQLRQVAELSVQSSSLDDDEVDDDEEKGSRRRLPEDNLKESEEHKLVREFCDAVEMPKLSEVRETFRRCCDLNCVNVVFLLGQEFGKEASGADSLMRAMLLLEPFLRSDLVKPEVYSKSTLDSLETIGKSSGEERVANKAKKLSLIIAALAKN